MSAIGLTPGYKSVLSVTPREIFFQPPERECYLPGGVIVDGAASYDGSYTYTYWLRAGWAMGQITSGGKWRPCTRTRANGAGSSSTSLTVDNAAAFKAADSIKVGSNAAQAIVSINYTTNVITLTSAITWSDRDAVIGQDGSQTCRGFLAEDVILRDPENINAADKIAKLVVGPCKLNKAGLLGDVDSIMAASGQFTSDIQIYSAGVRVL